MSREVSLMVSGVLVFLTPFFGVPTIWKDGLLFVLGAGIVLFALSLWNTRRHVAQKHTDSFREEMHT
jgi:hypothetical protein